MQTRQCCVSTHAPFVQACCKLNFFLWVGSKWVGIRMNKFCFVGLLTVVWISLQSLDPFLFHPCSISSPEWVRCSTSSFHSWVRCSFGFVISVWRKNTLETRLIHVLILDGVLLASMARKELTNWFIFT